MTKHVLSTRKTPTRPIRCTCWDEPGDIACPIHPETSIAEECEPEVAAMRREDIDTYAKCMKEITAKELSITEHRRQIGDPRL